MRLNIKKILPYFLTAIIILMAVFIFHYLILKKITTTEKNLYQKSIYNNTFTFFGDIDKNDTNIENLLSEFSNLNISYTDGIIAINDISWLFDTSSRESYDGKIIYFTAYRTYGGSYVLFKYYIEENILAPIAFIQTTLGYKSYKTLNLVTSAKLLFSPDDQNIILSTTDTFEFPEHKILVNSNGKRVPISLSKSASDIDWFNNNELYYTENDTNFINLYRVSDGTTSTTKIPSNHKIVRPRINPSANSFISVSLIDNSGGYRCGNVVWDVVIYSYPEIKEEHRIKNVHNPKYRWLINGQAEITYTHMISKESSETCGDTITDYYTPQT